MDKWLIFLLLFTAILAQTAYPQYDHWELLDCGLDSIYVNYDGWLWLPDEVFIYTGQKKTLQVNNNNLPGYINTLRYFPDGVKNCYTLYPDPQYKFIFRAGFYYGDYDGLSKPPTFDILLDDHFWATVNTSSSEVPFISSLEVAYLFIEYELNTPIMYSLMGNDTALNLVSRNAFGSLNKVLDNGDSNYNSSLGVCYDITFRVWQPKPVLGYLNISYSDVDENTCLNEACENQPPDALLKNAISPKNATDSIYLNVDFKNSTQQSAYFVFYFLDYNLSTNPNYTRKFEIHIDGAFKNVVELNNSQFGQVVSLFPVQVSGTANVTISPFSGSKFPPILNGMEVYTAMKMGSNNNVNVKDYYQGVLLDCGSVSREDYYDGEVPFISSLEVAYLLIDDNDTMYSLMGNDTALNLVSRNAFGGLNKVLDNGESNYNSSLSICYDITFRVWQPKSVPGYLNVSYSGGDETQSCLNQPLENRPPDDLLKNAISPENATDSIYLNVDFKNSTQQSAYFVFYFLDYNLSTNPYYTRKFEIHIDGALRNVVELNISQFGQVVSLFPVQVSGTANVTISPVSGSKFPPILNGMEVYTATKMDGTGSSHGFKLRCSGLSLLVFFVISFLGFSV
ncbi:hypothetical protein Patl1_06223 [Pistacia atlantica]|uniref:Uncharacterized protein n=1 Tax=Pistacia atlantica TaxID=434234 RepID=A0ACC1BRZ5_9ROSI|nr:hypothetical protein Patl1_06223 [Pistacia atlantica]